MIFVDCNTVGSGFLRVPHPRKYALPRSKKIENDTEEAEIYSVSMTHQLHCLVFHVAFVAKFLGLIHETGSSKECHNQVFQGR